MNNDYIISELLCSVLDDFDKYGDVKKMYDAINNIRIGIVEGRINELFNED